MTAPVLRVLIVDDEPHARQRLERLIGELEHCEVVGQCGNGLDALRLVEELEPSVALLDIRMPGMSGVETARQLSNLPVGPAVVFTTAYDQYAMEAFDAQAIGYLLKPVRKERLEKTLRQAARLTVSQLKLIDPAARDSDHRQHIAVRSRNELRLIPLAEVQYFRADQKYVSVHHSDGYDLIDDSLTDLAEEFASLFVRIHRSYLVSIAHLEAVERNADGKHYVRIRSCGELLPVGRRQVGELKRLLTAR
jgi:two-component system, LytTR family, response regulator AlgR